MSEISHLFLLTSLRITEEGIYFFSSFCFFVFNISATVWLHNTEVMT